MESGWEPGARFQSPCFDHCIALPSARLCSGVDLRMHCLRTVYLKRQRATNLVRLWFFQYETQKGKMLAYVPFLSWPTKHTNLLTEQSFLECPWSWSRLWGPSLILSGRPSVKAVVLQEFRNVSQLVGSEGELPNLGPSVSPSGRSHIGVMFLPGSHIHSWRWLASALGSM